MSKNRKNENKKIAIINEIYGLILILLSIFLVVSLATFRPENYPLFSKGAGTAGGGSTGLVGTFLAQYLVFALGRSAYSIPLILFFWASSFFMQRIPKKKILKFVGFLIFTLAAACFCALLGLDENRFQNGGVVGYFFAEHFQNYFGSVGDYFISSFLLILSFILATEFLIFPLIKIAAMSIWNALVWVCEGAMGLAEWFRRSKFKLPQIKIPRKKSNAVEKEKSELVAILRKAERQSDRKKTTQEKQREETEKTPSLFRDPPPALKITTYKAKQYSSVDAPKSDEEAIKEHDRRKKLLENFLKKRPKQPGDDAKQPLKAEVKTEIKAEAERLKKEIEAEEQAKSGSPEGASSEGTRKSEILEGVPSNETAKDKVKVGGHKKEEPEAVLQQEIEEELPPMPYVPPSIELFEKPVHQEVNEEDVVAKSQLLERTLADFGVEAKVVEVEQGPVITRYEVLPAPGVKVSSVTGLGDDIALALKAPTIRFIAPIPGKSAIGIEIPNLKTTTVFMRELLELEFYEEAKKKMRLPLLLGKKANGEPLIADLADMPHLLVAGTTGSGKTVCINSIIIGFICSMGPEDLRFVMVDPKMVELANYNCLPHMLMPVVTDSRKASMTLQGVVMEMENRYNLLATAGVRNIHSFNTREYNPEEKLDGKPLPKKMPYIVVLIDELADLMLVARDKVEAAIQRLAQLSRAVGIHLVLATQKPCVEVITGVIKANLPARIAFQVTSKIDSRIILDTGGADKLLGKGDMLFQPPGAPKPIRAQSTFINDKDIKLVLDFLKPFRAPKYVSAIGEIEKGSGGFAGHDMEKDELYEDAVRCVIETQQASVSTLQRRLGLGYARAARIMDMMEQQGLVGPPRGAKPREILVGRETEEISS